VTDDILARLRRIQRHALDLQAAVSAAQSRPLSSDGGRGTDPSGSVDVVVAPDGLPLQIAVRAGWQRQVRPEELGNAVLRAFAQAVAGPGRAAADSFDLDEWHSQVRRIEADSGDNPSRARALPQVEPYGSPRDPLALTEDVLNALKTVRDEGVASASQWTGWDGGRAVSITLGIGGLQACTVDPRWAAQRAASELTRALAEALSAARERKEQQAMRRRDESQRLESLAREALATLAMTQNVTPRREER